jgi:hypothetical protein
VETFPTFFQTFENQCFLSPLFPLCLPLPSTPSVSSVFRVFKINQLAVRLIAPSDCGQPRGHHGAAAADPGVKVARRERALDGGRYDPKGGGT